MCVPEVEAPVMTSVKVVPDDAQFAAGDTKIVFSSNNENEKIKLSFFNIFLPTRVGSSRKQACCG